MKTYKIVTLGCKVNAYESQALKEILEKEGYIEGENPDLVLINTCAVTKMAEHKSKQKVSSLSKKYPEAVIAVCGCSAQLHHERFEKISGVNIVLGNNNHSEIIDLINDYYQSKNIITKVDTNQVRNRSYQHLQITNFDEKARAYVKIGDGCNNFCAYCVIPLIRGNLRSRPKEEILCEIKTLVSNNYQEIVITGIDLASYGKDLENYDFNDLLEEIIKIEGLKRLRISSIEASNIDERFINILKNSKIIAPHLHIPLQSGSNTVLKRMRRKYTCNEFYNKISRIKQEIPDIALACDVIVGFPGETNQEFEETYEFIKKCGFAFLHVFPYSPREYTYASTMPNQISDMIKKERVNKLLELHQELSSAYQQRFIGKRLHVLFESYDKDKKMYYGLTENYLDYYAKSDVNLINKIIEVTYDYQK